MNYRANDGGAGRPRTDNYFSDLSEIPEAESQAQVVDLGGARITIGPGGAEVDFDPGARRRSPAVTGHNENLAESLQDSDLARISELVLEWEAVDEQARKPWKERIDQALELMGIAPLTLDDKDSLPGQSKLTHPLIAEACVQFQARAIEEIMPSAGPVKAIVVGQSSEEIEAQAQRVEDYMNYRLTEEDEGYYDDKDQALFLLPAYGSVFSKVYVDPVDESAVARTINPADLLVPYTAKSLKDTPRVCHRYRMDGNDVLRAMENGFFRHVDLQPNPVHESDDTTELEDRSDDKTPTAAQDDDDRTLLECHCNWRLPGFDDDEGFAPPYIVTVDKDSREVLAIRRNWREGDPKKKKRVWFVQYRYLPGFGIYGFGLLHLIGVLGQAVGGAIRGLIDAAVRSNFQGGFKSKEARAAGEVELEPGVWKDVDMSGDDLQKAFYTPPFKEPSPALFKLVEFLINSGQRFASVTEAMVGDAKTTGPVGTILAIIEQGSKVFSGIHKRVHRSMRQELKLLSGLIGDLMDRVAYPYNVSGESRQVLQTDFDDRVDVIPVSDPSIFSSTQRIAIAQATLELTTQAPQLYGEAGVREAHRRMLRALKVSDPDSLLPEKKVKRLDPVTENQLMLTGQPVQAFAEQDHAAHEQAHFAFMATLPPELQKQLDGPMTAHIAEHKAHAYRQQIEAQIGPLPPQDITNGETVELPPELEAMVARAVAMAQPQGATGPDGQPQQPGMTPEQAAELQETHKRLLQEQQKLQDMQRALEKARDQVALDKAKLQGDRERAVDKLNAQVQALEFKQRELEHAAEKARLALERAQAHVDMRLDKLKSLGDTLLKQVQAMPPAQSEQEAKVRDTLLQEIHAALKEGVQALTAPKTTTFDRGADGRLAGAKQTTGKPPKAKPEKPKEEGKE